MVRAYIFIVKAGEGDSFFVVLGIALFVQKVRPLYDFKDHRSSLILSQPPIASKPDVKQKLQSYVQFLKTGSTKSRSERQALRKLNKILSKSRMTEDL